MSELTASLEDAVAEYESIRETVDEARAVRAELPLTEEAVHDVIPVVNETTRAMSRGVRRRNRLTELIRARGDVLCEVERGLERAEEPFDSAELEMGVRQLVGWCSAHRAAVEDSLIPAWVYWTTLFLALAGAPVAYASPAMTAGVPVALLTVGCYALYRQKIRPAERLKQLRDRYLESLFPDPDEWSLSGVEELIEELYDRYGSARVRERTRGVLERIESSTDARSDLEEKRVELDEAIDRHLERINEYLDELGYPSARTPGELRPLINRVHEDLRRWRKATDRLSRARGELTLLIPRIDLTVKTVRAIYRRLGTEPGDRSLLRLVDERVDEYERLRRERIELEARCRRLRESLLEELATGGVRRGSTSLEVEDPRSPRRGGFA